MKHVTLWCYPRTGTTAYCEHLVNTKKVDSDDRQEFLGKYRYWPCFRDDHVDLSVVHFPPDRDFKKVVLDEIGIDKIQGDNADYITEKLLRQHYNEKRICK